MHLSSKVHSSREKKKGMIHGINSTRVEISEKKAGRNYRNTSYGRKSFQVKCCRKTMVRNTFIFHRYLLLDGSHVLLGILGIEEILGFRQCRLSWLPRLWWFWWLFLGSVSSRSFLALSLWWFLLFHHLNSSFCPPVWNYFECMTFGNMFVEDSICEQS